MFWQIIYATHLYSCIFPCVIGLAEQGVLIYIFVDSIVCMWAFFKSFWNSEKLITVCYPDSVDEAVGFS